MAATRPSAAASADERREERPHGERFVRTPASIEAVDVDARECRTTGEGVRDRRGRRRLSQRYGTDASAHPPRLQKAPLQHAERDVRGELLAGDGEGEPRRVEVGELSRGPDELAALSVESPEREGGEPEAGDEAQRRASQRAREI